MTQCGDRLRWRRVPAGFLLLPSRSVDRWPLRVRRLAIEGYSPSTGRGPDDPSRAIGIAHLTRVMDEIIVLFGDLPFVAPLVAKLRVSP